MEKPLQLGFTPDETKGLEAAVDDLLTEIKRATKQMKNDQVEIDRLRVETRAILAKLKAA